MYCLYKSVHDSFCCPKEVPVSALRALSLLCVDEDKLRMCGVKVMWGSRVIPSILGFLFRGIRSPNKVTCG